MPEQNKMTFAQKAILNRIAQKEQWEKRQKFQDYTEHTDYTEAWSMTLDAKGTPVDCDYNETHGDYCDFAPAPAELPKPTFFQSLFGKHR